MKYKSDLTSRNFDLSNLSSDQKKQLDNIQKKEIDFRMLTTYDEITEEEKNELAQSISSLKSEFEATLTKNSSNANDKNSENVVIVPEKEGSKGNGILMGALAAVGVGLLSALFIISGNNPPKSK